MPSLKRSAETQIGIQPSPSVAARRIAAGERPPTHSGGPPGCAGPGSISTSSKEKNRPEKLARPRKSSRSARIASSVRAPALARVDADRLEILRALAADADAEDHAAARDVVERGELLGHDARMPQRQQHDRRRRAVIRSVAAANVESATTMSRIGLRYEMWSPAQIES